MTRNQTMAALLEHDAFVRSLARSLAGDRALADDLAQDTWVAALRRPPSDRGSPRGWLARIMHNRLRNLRRGDARRTAREAVVAQCEADDRSEALRERLDLQHRVVAAVLELPETYRSVVLLHFFDGLGAAEIAHRRGVPAATVRSQLKRGLDRVRARLDRDQPGGRAAWCALLLAFEHEVPKQAGPPTGSGSGVLSAVGAVVVGSIALGLFGPFGGDEAPMASTDARVTQDADPAEAAARFESAHAGMSVAVDRVPLPSPPERVIVVCKDEGDRPVSDAEVHVFQQTPRPDGKSRYRQSGPFTSDATGRAVGPVALTYDGGKYDCFVYARVPGRLVGGGRGLRWEASDDPRPPIEVTLVSSRTVRGKVTVPDGFDVTAVNLRVHAFHAPVRPPVGSFARRLLDWALPERFDCRPAADGTFELADLPAEGRIYLMAEASGLGQGQYANVGPGNDRIPDVVELTLWEEGVVRGVVLGLGGAVAADARVAVRPHGGRGIWVTAPFETTTDTRGEFSLVGLPADDFDVYVETTDPESVFRPRSVKVQRGQAIELELQLERGVRVAGRVVDEQAGTGIGGVAVIAIEPHEFGTQPRLGWSTTDEDGAFELQLPVGPLAIYFSNKPSRYAYPEPQIVQTLVIGDDRAPVDGLRFTLARSGEK